MFSVIRFFSLALAFAPICISPVNAYVVPRATVDYRRHDVNVRIVEETRSIPSIASPPSPAARQRGVRDFRFPNRLRTRETLHQPDLDDVPDVVPTFPMEEAGSGDSRAVHSSSAISPRDQTTPRDLPPPHTDATSPVIPRNAAGLVQLDLLNTYYQQMVVNSGNLRKGLPLQVHRRLLMISFQETTVGVLATRETTLGFGTILFGNSVALGITWAGPRAFLEISAVTKV